MWLVDAKLSHDDVLAPAVDKWPLFHGFWFDAEIDKGSACSLAHVHAGLLLSCPHKEGLIVLVSFLSAL